MRNLLSRSPATTSSGAESTPVVPVPPPTLLVTRSIKLGMWGLVACGPLSLVVALGGSTSAGPPAPVLAQRSGIGPAGFAELHVAAYLESDGAMRESTSRNPARLPLLKARGWDVTRTTVTGVREIRPGYWSVTVAAEVAAAGHDAPDRAAGIRYFAVPVIAAGDAAAGGTGPPGSPVAYSAAAPLAQLSGPGKAAELELGYDTSRSISRGPLADTVRQFARSYLTATGELARYMSPGKIIQPVTPASYRTAEVPRISPAGKLPGDEMKVPADRTTVNVLADVEVTDDAGRRLTLAYALTLTARAGRWEIAALDAAPLLEPRLRHTPSTPTQSPDSPAVPAPSTSTSATSQPTP